MKFGLNLKRGFLKLKDSTKYRFPEEDRREEGYTCDKKTHQTRIMRYEGPLEVEICIDAKCAKIFAHCTHQLNGKSICTWDDRGQSLTCQFCGVDGT